MAQENGSGGQPRRGFEFGSGPQGGRGPRGPGGEGGRGGRDGRRGDRRGPDGGGAAQRLLGQISVLEKALSKADFAGQSQVLGEMVRLLKPLRLTSLDGLDFTARGRLLTTLLRVGRQPKPPEPETPPNTGVEAPPEAAPDAAPDAPAEAV
ncbi:MAG TPA: DEAD/DEAH box helicase, partial [Myxococcaceae bacterium]|nr:DEAD/DEAH box helicase [Myxococcaceae bacterium]